MDETGIDRDTMAGLARALAFIRTADDPTVIAMREAAATGKAADVKKARQMFLKLAPAVRRSALDSLMD